MSYVKGKITKIIEKSPNPEQNFEKLEEVMGLLAYPNEQLTGNVQKIKITSELNSALLLSKG